MIFLNKVFIKRGNKVSYCLKKGIYKVKCNEENCPFDIKLEITNNITAITEKELDIEAKKFVSDISKLKHDELYLDQHAFNKKSIEKISAIYEAVDSRKSSIIIQNEPIVYKEYKKGDVIIGKDDIFYSVCEVVKGSAYQDKNKNKVYNVGDNFGASELIINQNRIVNIVAGQDNATIAFYNLKELSKKDPAKAKELYKKSTEDIFEIITSMEEIINKQDNLLEKEENENKNKNEFIKYLMQKFSEMIRSKFKNKK